MKSCTVVSLAISHLSLPFSAICVEREGSGTRSQDWTNSAGTKQKAERQDWNVGRTTHCHWWSGINMPSHNSQSVMIIGVNVSLQCSQLLMIKYQDTTDSIKMASHYVSLSLMVRYKHGFFFFYIQFSYWWSSISVLTQKSLSVMTDINMSLFPEHQISV